MSEHTCEAYNYAETRTPTDMETEMSDIENASYEMSGGIAVFVASTTSDPIWAGDLLKAYQALSALGDPVVVAEALPELVEALGDIIGEPVMGEVTCKAGSRTMYVPWSQLRRARNALKQLED